MVPFRELDQPRIYTIRVWYIPYAYGMNHTRMVRFRRLYAYGTILAIPYAYQWCDFGHTIRVWYDFEYHTRIG